MKATISYKCTDGRIGCGICKNRGITVTYSAYSGLSRHYKVAHKDRDRKQVMITPKNDKITELTNQVATLIDEIRELKEKGASQPTIVNNNNVTNNTINIFFNKDLKYYPELVKIMGRDKAGDYLLFKMPESKDLFGVLDKLFTKDGTSVCPIQIDDDGFIVTRSATEFDVDPTGDMIDKENKSKLQDAILSAYIDSTKAIDNECDKLRVKRVNGEYNEEDSDTLNRRFESVIEPSRPYEVIDLMNSIKPKKKDFDRLRRICPKVAKK